MTNPFQLPPPVGSYPAGTDANALILLAFGALAFVAGILTGGLPGFGFRSRSERHVSSDGRHVVEQTSARDY
jgi:hypothetical protein